MDDVIKNLKSKISDYEKEIEGKLKEVAELKAKVKSLNKAIKPLEDANGKGTPKA